MAVRRRPKKHLVIPDSHAHPDFNNRRYELLGHLITDVKPDVVVDIGDWYDMPSLCSYDKGTKGFEGRRYRRDIEAGNDAQDRLLSIVRRQKRKLPHFVRTLGNHENRISKAVDRDPVLEGTIGLGDLLSREYKWEEVPFLDIINLDGVNYSHYFTTGVMGRPVSGEHPGYTLLTKKFESCTMGHVHTYDHCVRSVGRQKIHGLVCGVFQDYDADYAGPANDIWNRGVVIKHDVMDGDYDLEWISLARLERTYGRL